MRSYDNELRHWGILGMKWGVRRYQNKDGTLTDAGKKRYDKDISNNKRKKSKDRIDTSKPDAERWVNEDLQRRKDIVDESNRLVNDFKRIERETTPKPKKERMDLSEKSNKELQEAINRETLELRYNDLFSKPAPVQISKGRQITRDVLDVAGDILPIAGSSLSIALAIRALRGK